MDAVNSIESNKMLVLMLLRLFLIASLICTVTMLVILVKKGDERKKYIVSKSGLFSLILGIILLILSFVWKVFFEAESRIGFESSPIIYLGFISIVFNISYLINSKRYR